MKYLLFLSLLLVGCKAKTSTEFEPETLQNKKIRVYEDSKRGVVCYTFWQDAISCVKLDKEEAPSCDYPRKDK